jgi:DNA-binding Lrp family transcriptional regulator/nitrite reductase/ring-hydroxylating ferredoxin subunit
MLDTLDGGSVSTAEPIEAASPAVVGAGVNGSGSGAAPTPNPQPPTASRADGFVEVAKVVDVPAGSSKLVVVNGEQIALYNVDGTFYALGNRCSHARGPLVDGTVCAGALGAKVECPWHGAEFDLQTGAALSRPARGPVPAYQVTLEGDAVLVGPQKTEADLQPKEQGQARELPARVDDQLDAVDKKLVNVMQHAFPVVSRPWQALAEEVGTTEVGVMQRITRLREIGVVRQISPIFDTRKLGYKSSLVAVRVAPERLEDAAAVINSHPGVSHNYRRDHYFNMWFTIAVPPDGDLDAEVQRLTERAGVEKVRMLPTLKMYKIAVKLNMEADETTLGKDNTPYIKAKDVRPLTERDKELIRATQDDMPLVAQPFKQLAEQAGITEDALFAWLNEMQQMNYLRRIAAILRHQKAGFTDNGMITWKVPEDKVDEAGRIAAAYPTVSHCYRRPVYEDWPYNFFSMVHARSRENAEEIGRQIAQELKPLGVTEYVILFSTKEFKKDRVRYFVDWNAQDAPAAATVAAK